MLRAIPKHKGTEHLQADIKARIKVFAEELESARKGGGHGGPALVIHPEGAAQIALIGPPNAGKSSLHARLTGSGAHVAPYPFTTQYPQAGMMPYEDVHFQLIDLPAIAPEHPVPWLVSTLQTANAALPTGRGHNLPLGMPTHLVRKRTPFPNVVGAAVLVSRNLIPFLAGLPARAGREVHHAGIGYACVRH
jgi:hypothetical protein